MTASVSPLQGQMASLQGQMTAVMEAVGKADVAMFAADMDQQFSSLHKHRGPGPVELKELP